MERPGTHFKLEVYPTIPAAIARLEEIADNLWYSWDRSTRALFSRLHPGLWDAVGHSPKSLLRRIDEDRLIAALDDPVFMNAYNRVLAAYDAYHGAPVGRAAPERLGADDLVAYFCAEFGFHESLPIYSGGLGILAGCRSSVSACSIARAISTRRSTPPVSSTPPTTTRISTACRSRR